MPKTIQPKTDEEWATMVKTQHESGLSVAKFCRQNNINQQTFYRHRNRIQHQTLHKAVEKFVKVEASSDTPNNPIPVPTDYRSISLTIGHVSISLCDRTSPLWVAQLIREVNV
ncbi:transposase [Vibrio mediterranei]|uniref:IS66 family insertion sequence element accessory protein TnpA n=1 Tax=Vibrio mediterranei TaxID=689 RepID=UPI0038CDF0F9